MLIIWGTKQITKNFGCFEQIGCSRCNNIVNWQLVRVQGWFTLFWIPIFPFSTKYFEVCPICNGTVQLAKEEFFAKVDRIAPQQLPEENA